MTTRERLAAEAMRLFAGQGFERTTVADIQGAAGLSRGSGALYKHFGSKDEVLRASVERSMDRLRRLGRPGRPPRGRDLRAMLRSLARFVLDELGAERDLMRILLREGDRFPELLAEAREHVIQASHRAFAAWIRAAADSGVLRARDPEAVGAVALSALVHYVLDETMLGEPPGRIAEDRFVAGWVDLVAALAAGKEGA